MTGQNTSACIRYEHDAWRDECGVFGVYAPGEDVARLCFFGLFALQHRGQESAGIAVADRHEVYVHRGMGLAFAVFNEENLAQLSGDIGLAHVRYSTTGSNVLANAQPMVGVHRSGPFAVGHNGNLVNYRELRQRLEREGVEFHATSDTEVIVHLIARSEAANLEAAVADAMCHMRGAYSLGIIGPGKLIAARDPHGVRPLSLGSLNDNGKYVIASEDCAFHVVGARYIREVEPGEVVVIDKGGLQEFQAVPMSRKSVCIFEYIYFARPDSHIYGKSVYNVRQGLGRLLALQRETEADIVVGVPESAIPHAIGYAQISKIPYQEGFIKNRYIFRTFIQPDQRLRELGVRMKLAPLRETLAGRRVVVVDDSIVRGTTTKQEIALMRDAGAREIHMRVCSPPIRYPCFYGVDTSAGRKELIAAQLSVEEICQHIGANSLEYLSLENLIAATGLSKRHFCTACFDRRYPIRVPPEVRIGKFDLEQKQVVLEPK
ncbi:MAG: amidophosphoribosyltransferase [Candidatus Zipacnadales bacterium]